MIPLSPETEKLINCLFTVEEASRLKIKIASETSKKIPFFTNCSPKDMERLRFSIVKLIHENKMNENEVFKLAQTDPRDLFVASGNHLSVNSHEIWAESIFANSKSVF